MATYPYPVEYSAYRLLNLLNGIDHSQSIYDGAIVTQDFLTRKLIEGKMFAASAYNLSLANNASFDICITTGPYPVFVTVSISAGGQAFISLYEGVTITGGTNIPIYNQRRDSLNLQSSVMVHTPNVGDLGLELWPDTIPGGSGGNKAGYARPGSWRCLAPNTTYLRRITNKSGNNMLASFMVDLYEES